MTPDQITATADSLSRFPPLITVLIIIAVVFCIAIIFLGRHWLNNKAEQQKLDNESHIAQLDNENKLKMSAMENDRTQWEEESRALTLNSNNRFERLEATVDSLRLDVTELETNQSKILATQEEHTKHFGSITKSLDQLFFMIADQKEQSYKVSQGTLENMLFNDQYPSMFNRLKAFYRLTAMAINGRVQKKGLELVLHNKELWLDVLSQKPDVEMIDREYFDNTMELVNKQVYDGLMGAA